GGDGQSHCAKVQDAVQPHIALPVTHKILPGVRSGMRRPQGRALRATRGARVALRRGPSEPHTGLAPPSSRDTGAGTRFASTIRALWGRDNPPAATARRMDEAESG